MGQMLHNCRFTTQAESVLRIHLDFVGLVGFVNHLLFMRRRNDRFIISGTFLRLAALSKDEFGQRQDAALFHLQICIPGHDETKLLKFGALAIHIFGDPMANCAVAIILET